MCVGICTRPCESFTEWGPGIEEMLSMINMQSRRMCCLWIMCGLQRIHPPPHANYFEHAFLQVECFHPSVLLGSKDDVCWVHSSSCDFRGIKMVVWRGFPHSCVDLSAVAPCVVMMRGFAGFCSLQFFVNAGWEGAVSSCLSCWSDDGVWSAKLTL